MVTVGSLERLAIVGNTGMGALTYRPTIPLESVYNELTLDEIAKECERILQTDTSEKLDYLFAKGDPPVERDPKYYHV